MLIRWDTLLIAAAIAGTSMLIENSHRVDTGAPDDDVTAISTETCVLSPSASLYGWNRETDSVGDQVSDDAASASYAACADR